MSSMNHAKPYINATKQGNMKVARERITEVTMDSPSNCVVIGSFDAMNVAGKIHRLYICTTLQLRVLRQGRRQIKTMLLIDVTALKTCHGTRSGTRCRQLSNGTSDNKMR